jgi:hypothetical protein
MPFYASMSIYVDCSRVLTAFNPADDYSDSGTTTQPQVRFSRAPQTAYSVFNAVVLLPIAATAVRPSDTCARQRCLVNHSHIREYDVKRCLHVTLQQAEMYGCVHEVLGKQTRTQ